MLFHNVSNSPLSKGRIQNHPPAQRQPSEPACHVLSPPSFHQRIPSCNGAEACSSHGAVHKRGQRQSKSTRRTKSSTTTHSERQSSLRMQSSGLLCDQQLLLGSVSPAIPNRGQSQARSQDTRGSCKTVISKNVLLKIIITNVQPFSLKPLTVFIFL